MKAKTKTNFTILTLFLLTFFSCEEDKIPIAIPPDQFPECMFTSLDIGDISCVLDESTNTFFYSINENTNELTEDINLIGEFLKIQIDGTTVDNSSSYTFSDIEINQAIPIEITFCDNVPQSYQLIFTSLPIIHLSLDGKDIYNDPKQAINFQLYDPDYLDHGFSNPVFNSTIGIEVRGGSSRVYPKKAYGFELWGDESGSEKIDAPLLGMRDDDDWILDAMFVDIAKMRNRVCMDVWSDISVLHYQDEEPEAQSAIQGKPVEIFIDNNYHGLYFLNERVDRKMLQLKKSEEDDIEGLLYKASFWGDKIVKFENYYPSDPTSDFWDGWEQDYPDPDDFIHWQPLDEFTDFVLNAEENDFIEEVGEKLLLNNAMDYFILLNLMRGDDNTGKNVFFARYDDDSPFFMVPWDMDSTWGRDFLAFQTLPQGILSNGLFDRLLATNPDNFKIQLKQRWFSLRNGTLSDQHLKSYFDIYIQAFISSGAFERDVIKWERNSNLENEEVYIKNWIDDRLVFLDDFYQNL